MSNKISSIVFSRDKAAQLKLFLDSVQQNARDVFDLTVIIDYTEPEYNEGYNKVVTDYAYGDVNFVYAEENFKNQVLDIMKDSGEYFTFFLDDDIIYNKIELADIVNTIDSDDDLVCFSLRLGENTTKCYTLGADNVMHDIIKEGNIMKWDWSLHYLDFGYPFAMDGHIFRKSDILKLVKKSTFSCVEELEMALFDFAEMFPRNKMASYTQSALVGVPVGRVQESLDSEMAMALKESRARLMRKEMNTIFLEGSFISLEEINFSEVNGCHQELDLGVELKKQEENG